MRVTDIPSDDIAGMARELAKGEAVAVPIFTPTEWEKLRGLAGDHPSHWPAYSTWLNETDARALELQARGVRVQRVEIDTAELNAWCYETKRRIASASLVEFAVLKLIERSSKAGHA